MTKKENEAEEKRKLAVLAKAGETAIGIKSAASHANFRKLTDAFEVNSQSSKGRDAAATEISKLDQNKLFQASRDSKL